jgi:hypothetical protein
VDDRLGDKKELSRGERLRLEREAALVENAATKDVLDMCTAQVRPFLSLCSSHHGDALLC